jgi:glucosamine kinase
VTDLWLAVDGGQSATIAMLATGDGIIRGVGRGGPIRHHTEPGAEADARQALGAAVGAALGGVGSGDTIVCASLSLTGSVAFVEAAVRELVPGAHVVVLASDALAALAAGTLGAGGIGLIAGTGTVAVAQGRRGGPIVRGGWGWLLGDEGGGFWIGLEGLRAAARALDGTGPGTRLSEVLPARLGHPAMRGVRERMTRPDLDRAEVAALAEEVDSTAKDGDAVAVSILDEAARRLAALVLATIEGAAFLEQDERVVVGSGGVLRSGRVVAGLRQRLEEQAPGFRFVVPGVAPVIGAYYLALLEHGIPISEATRERIVADGATHELGRKAGSSVRS